MDKTMEPLPYFKWLWRDWRANRRVQKLNYVARGLYRELLDEQWSEGSIPSDLGDLADICDCPVEVMQEHWPKLSQFFEETENGRLINNKLEQQRTSEDSKRAALARNGRKGALAKAKQLPEDGGNCHIAEQSRAEQKQSISEQEDDVKIQTEAKSLCEAFGMKAGGYVNDWAEMATLARVHKTGTVVNDLKAYLDEYRGDDFPRGVIPKYLQVAHDRLSSDTAPVSVVLKDPEVNNLVRELGFLSDGKISFLDKQRVRLAEVLKEFSADEIIACFKNWLYDQDLEDPKTSQYGPGKFVQVVDTLAYAARKKKAEAEKTRIEREAVVKRLQEEAEINRLARDKMEQDEAGLFDPLAQ